MGSIGKAVGNIFGGIGSLLGSDSGGTVQEATASQSTGQGSYQADNTDLNKKRAMKTGKQQLQIPTGGATASTSVPVSGAGVGTGV